jgi:hypothetical protein
MPPNEHAKKQNIKRSTLRQLKQENALKSTKELKVSQQSRKH